MGQPAGHSEHIIQPSAAACPPRAYSSPARAKLAQRVWASALCWPRPIGASGLDTAIRDVDAPDTWSRTSQYRARRDQCRRLGPRGRLVETIGLEMNSAPDAGIAIQNPIAMLLTAAESSVYYADLLESAYDARPCDRRHPWSIVLYPLAWLGGPPTRRGRE